MNAKNHLRFLLLDFSSFTWVCMYMFTQYSTVTFSFRNVVQCPVPNECMNAWSGLVITYHNTIAAYDKCSNKSLHSSQRRRR